MKTERKNEQEMLQVEYYPSFPTSLIICFQRLCVLLTMNMSHQLQPIDRSTGLLASCKLLHVCCVDPTPDFLAVQHKKTQRVLIYQSRKSCQPSKSTDTISKLLQLQLLNLESESQLKSINNNITTHDFDFIFSNNCHCISQHC